MRMHRRASQSSGRYNHFPMKNPSGKSVRGVVLFLNGLDEIN